jgi:hypothetical protein
MKRKEFIEKLAGRCGRSADNPTRFDAIAATLAEEAGAQWDPEEPELRPCPNPECAKPRALRVQWLKARGRVVCDGCSAEGPAGRIHRLDRGAAEVEAIRLWNLLPRIQDEAPSSDPEEPELPERLRLETIGTGTHDDPWLVIAVPETDSDGYHDRGEANAYVPEQVACYNFVRRLHLEDLARRDLHDYSPMYLSDLLRQEREKLR